MMKSIFTAFVIILLSVQLHAQDEKESPAKQHFNKALQYLGKGEYDKAIQASKKAIEKDPDFLESYILMGDAYSKLKKTEEEKEAYRAALLRDSLFFSAIYNLGSLEFATGNYKAAIPYYEKTRRSKDATNSQKDLAAYRIRLSYIRMDLLAHPVPYNPINIGDGVNSKADEYFPTFTVDGKTMFYTRNKPEPAGDVVEDGNMRHKVHLQEDVMYSTKTDSGWAKGKDVPNMNTPDNEGAMCIAPDGSFMVFTRCKTCTNCHGGCDLYIAKKLSNGWDKPELIPDPVSTTYYETQPSISYDGNSIYFAAQRKGGVGDLDIYVTHRRLDGFFGTPENLGPKINTKGEESAPFIHPDNQTLYFISNGHPGLGNRDIFVARKNKAGEWDSIRNVGYPINTASDEMGLTVDRSGRIGYVTSENPKTSKGGYDIYSFELPEQDKARSVTFLKGKVFDAESKTTLAASFELADLETGETVTKSVTLENGQFLVPIPGGHDYLLNVSAQGYLFYSDNIPLKNYSEQKPFEQDIPLQPIKAGSKISLRNIFFNTDAYELKKESVTELNRLVGLLQANPTMKIEISGHTDNTGSAAHNKDLSLKRAQSMYNYLIKEGKIDAARLKFAGYGDSQPIADNNTESGKALNRRTEVKVIQ